jgi:hypothetical protein
MFFRCVKLLSLNIIWNVARSACFHCELRFGRFTEMSGCVSRNHESRIEAERMEALEQ